MITAGLVISACGGSGSTKDASSPTSAAIRPAGSSETKLTLTVSDLHFDKAELKASPGKVTIEYDNKDAGVPHNLHVFKGRDATGASLGMTDIATGTTQQTLTLTLEKGDYYYQCDVHPTTTTGQLTVE